MNSPEHPDYIPLNPRTCSVGDRHGPIQFSVRQESHDKHLKYLSRLCPEPAVRGNLQSLSQTVLPFEAWSMSRVLSAAKYRRLNEVLLLSASRRVTALPPTGTLLIGDAEIASLRETRGLAVASIRSRTLNEHGDILLESEDTVLLLNASDATAIRAAIARSERRVWKPEPGSIVVAKGLLDMRYDWPEDLWKNNIHTDSYAKRLGFRGALIEGPAVLDLLLVIGPSCFASPGDLPLPFEVSWTHMAPAYRGLHFEYLKTPPSRSAASEFVMCAPTDADGRYQPLVAIRRREL